MRGEVRTSLRAPKGRAPARRRGTGAAQPRFRQGNAATHGASLFASAFVSVGGDPAAVSRRLAGADRAPRPGGADRAACPCAGDGHLARAAPALVAAGGRGGDRCVAPFCPAIARSRGGAKPSSGVQAEGSGTTSPCLQNVPGFFNVAFGGRGPWAVMLAVVPSEKGTEHRIGPDRITLGSLALRCSPAPRSLRSRRSARRASP
jgi:hypothetical protein